MKPEKKAIEVYLIRFARLKNLNYYDIETASVQAEFLSGGGYTSEQVNKALLKLIDEPMNSLPIDAILENLPKKVSPEIASVIEVFQGYFYKLNSTAAKIGNKELKELSEIISLSLNIDAVKSKIKEFYSDCTWAENSESNRYWFVKGHHDFNLKNFVKHYDEIQTYKNDRKALEAGGKALHDKIMAGTAIKQIEGKSSKEIKCNPKN